MMNGYLIKDWEQLTKELQDAFHHTNSRVYMYMRSYLELLCNDQLEGGNVGLKAFILTYDNISCYMINKRTLTEYTQVGMILGALRWDLRATMVMKPEPVPRDPETFEYNKLRIHVLDKYVPSDALTLMDADGAHMAPGVSSYSIPAGVPLPQMAAVVNLPAIPSKETPAPAQAMEEIPITKADNTIDTKMHNMMKAFEAWTLRLSKANEPRYGGYQTARAYTIQADHPPRPTPINFPPLEARMGPAHYPLGPNSQQYPW